MTHPRRRTRWRATLKAVGAALVVLAPLPAAAVSPTPAPPAAALPVQVTLVALKPTAPQPGDTLQLRGTLTNTSTSAVTDLQLQLRYRPTHIGSRNEFDAYACGVGCTKTAGGSPLPLPPVVVGSATASLAHRSLAPGEAETFTISAPMKSFDLGVPWQVYELGVGVNGTTALGGFTTVGGLRTFLPWAPVDTPGHGYQTQVAWIWPLVDRPHRSVGNTWLDDDLATSIGDHGRLSDLLTAAIAAQDQTPRAQQAPAKGKAKSTARPRVPVSQVPVTWAVDPMLVEDLDAMASGYRIGTGAKPTAGKNPGQAKAWLDALRSAVGRGELLGLPYADPDVVAAARGGLTAQVQGAIHSGETLLTRALGAAPLSYSWPPSGQLDQRTLDALFAANVTTVVLDSSALPIIGGEPSVTPGAHTTVRSRDGNLDALLLDSGLDTVVGIGATDPAKQALAVQRFLGETLMIQAELPGDQRTLVVAPDRRWAPNASYARTLLTDTGKVPWIQPVPLSAALASPVQTTVTRGPLHDAGRPAELPRSYVNGVHALSQRADRFAAILATGDPQARAFDDAVLRTLSSAYRDELPRGIRYRDTVADDLSSTMDRVRIASLPRSFVTLTSHSGTVPITVGNELDTAVRVVVAIHSQHLTVTGGGRATQVIPPHRKVAVDVRATARTAGVFQLDVTLLTPNGQVYDSEQLFVRSTAYGTVAILITGGATGVLLIAVIIRLGRRALRARRAAGAAA